MRRNNEAERAKRRVAVSNGERNTHRRRELRDSVNRRPGVSFFFLLNYPTTRRAEPSDNYLDLPPRLFSVGVKRLRFFYELYSRACETCAKRARLLVDEPPRERFLRYSRACTENLCLGRKTEKRKGEEQLALPSGNRQFLLLHQRDFPLASTLLLSAKV